MANNPEMKYGFIPPRMDTPTYHPRVSISFHTETIVYHANSNTVNQFGTHVDPNNQVLSVMTSKTLASPAGNFNITLAGHQWATYLSPQNVAIIQMGYMGESMITVMVGLIDRVERKRAMGGDGKATVNTIVTGRDFGKLFVKDLLKFYPEIAGRNASDFFLTDVGWINLMKVFTADSTLKGTPAVIIDNIMRYIFPKIHNVSWTMWDESSAVPTKRQVNASSMIDYVLGRTNFFMPFIFTADQYEGALWNLMQRAAPQTFTELFIDTRSQYEVSHSSVDADHQLVPNANIEKDSAGLNPYAFGSDKVKICLCLRNTPYDSKDKNRLIRHDIAQVDVLDEDLYMTDEQHYNLFWAGTTINPLGIDLKRVAPPMLNEANAKKYGLSPLEVNVEGMSISDETVLEGMSRTYTGKLKAWFENNHLYWQGTLDIRGKADIRVGQMVRLLDGWYEVYDYYVEGVNQTFTVFEGWTTSLTLTRGMLATNIVDSSPYVWSPPAPPPPPQAPPTPPSTTYTVVKGDTLWAIAKRKYGNPLQWRKIWNANSTMLIARDRRNASDSGHWIYPGQKLIIPA